MPPYSPNQFVRRHGVTRQPVRLLTAHEKPQRCDWPKCAKPATGADEHKVYCSSHFFAVVSKHW